MTRPSVLIVDDEAAVRFGIRDFLESKGWAVEEAGSCQAGLAAFRSTRPEIAILDYSLPDGTALELLPKLKASETDTALVILTGHGSIDLAVRAIKEGADHFLTKPVELPALLSILERLIENQRNRQRQLASRSSEARHVLDPFVGTSPAIRRLAEDARRFVAADSAVLIQGETGTGKGVLAGWLHRNGPRADQAFVDLNCATLSKDLLENELFGHEKGAFTGAVAAKPGLLDVAHRGTVFLDEIGDVDPLVQPKLLKVLEEQRFRRLGDVRDRQVDVRLITATHQDLTALVRDKRFRSDLYFRINTIPLNVPALRERREDVELLSRAVLEGIASELGRGGLSLSPEAVRALERYPWPGNIRELRNVLERAVLLCEGRLLGVRDLRFEPQASAAPAADTSLTLLEMERRHIENVLREENGRVEAAARRLGVPRSSLYQRLKRFGLQPPREERDGRRSTSAAGPDPEGEGF
jgi:DNA-binding NtrC family response regulator